MEAGKVPPCNSFHVLVCDFVHVLLHHLHLCSNLCFWTPGPVACLHTAVSGCVKAFRGAFALTRWWRCSTLSRKSPLKYEKGGHYLSWVLDRFTHVSWCPSLPSMPFGLSALPFWFTWSLPPWKYLVANFCSLLIALGVRDKKSSDNKRIEDLLDVACVVECVVTGEQTAKQQW